MNLPITIAMTIAKGALIASLLYRGEPVSHWFTIVILCCLCGMYWIAYFQGEMIDRYHDRVISLIEMCSDILASRGRQ